MASKHERAIAKLFGWKNKKRYKLWEMAEMTSVSVATLSNAIRRPAQISDDTVDAILKAQEPK